MRDNSSDSFYACFAIYPNPLRNWVYIHFKRGAIVLSLQDGHCRASKTVIDDGSPLCFLLDLKIMPMPEGTGGGDEKNKSIMSAHLLHIAVKLVEAMDKGKEEALPQEIADVVKLHAKIAVGSAWIPVPGADVAAGAANIWTMYLRINSKLGM